ncbi:hypothetical protein LguiB_002111 [Lonicera macranthoides]
MSDYLPEEVLVDIFSRLPVKTLIQVRCVCKQWFSLISNPNFATAHIDKTKNSDKLILRHFTEKERDGKEHYLLLENDQTLHVHDDVKLEFPFKTRSRHNFRVVGSCNGLLCLSDDLGVYAFGIILWNPSIRRFVTLPTPRVTKRTHGSYSLVLGFGFDCKSNDYKVVRIAYVKGRNGCELIPPEVEVYSLSSGSWRSFVAGAPPYGIYYGYTGSNAFLNGTLHWIGYDPCKKGSNGCLIVSFDMGDEVFREVMLPDSLAHCAWDLSISHYGELLSVLQYEQRAKEHYFSLWVMKEYGVVDSWTKLYTIDTWGGLHKTVGFTKHGEVLMVTARGKMLLYDRNTRQKSNFGIRGAIDSFFVDNYMDSLVLLKGGSAILGGDAIVCEGGEEDGEALQWPRFARGHVDEHKVSGFGGEVSSSEICADDDSGWGNREWTT